MHKLSSFGLLLVSLIALFAGTLLVASLLLCAVIDANKVISFALIVIVLTCVLVPRTREMLITYFRKIIYRPLRGSDNVAELDLPEMNYFVTGDEQDVLIVGNDGTYWGRGFLKLSKTVRSTPTPSTERNRIDTRMMFDAFIESAYSNKIPVQSVLSLSPIDEDEIVNKTPYLVNTSPSQIANMDKEQRQSLVRSKMGVWRSRMIISTRSSSKPPSKIREVVEEVRSKVLQLKALFNASFPEYVVEKVTGKKELRKIAFFMLTHSEGNNFMQDGGGTARLTGKELRRLMTIPPLVTSFYPESFPYKEFQLHPVNESDVIIGTYVDDAGNRAASAGLDASHVSQGIAVFGEDEAQIDLTNKVLVSRLVMSNTPYIIFTSDEKYRPLLSLFPDAITVQLGKGFTINPLDTEGTDADQYIPLILSVFENTFPLNDEQVNMLFAVLHDVYAESKTPTLAMLKEHVDDIIVSGRETLGRTRLLEGILRTLTPLLSGNAAEALSGSSTIQFKGLLEGTKQLTIIEFKGTTDPSSVRFIQGMILAKMYALHASRRGTMPVYGQRMLLLEETELMFKQVTLRRSGSSNPASETMLKWIDDLPELGVGLHISTTKSSQADEQIFARVGTKIVHRVSRKDDIHFIAKHIDLEQRPSTRRSFGTDVSNDRALALRYLAEDEALLVRPDSKKPFPIKVAHSDVARLPTPSEPEIKRRTNLIMRGDNGSLKEPKTLLEVDYEDKEERRIAKEILELLDDYPNFGRENIINSFDGDEQQEVRTLLPKLENYRYVASSSVRIEGGNLRKVYRLTEKGRKSLEDEKRIERELDIGRSLELHEKPTATKLGSTEEKEENSEKTEFSAGLRPVFKGAIGGLRTAKSLYESQEYDAVVKRVSEILKKFLETLARSVQVKTEGIEEDELNEIIDRLSDSGLPFPPDKSGITWIGKRARESRSGEGSISCEEALKALQDAVAFLKQASRIFHVE
nr:helix-turn-helix transcriptional regulator [Candidatus Njordarchaeota archaeon]